MIGDIRKLDIVRVLGSERNSDELHLLLQVIEGTVFAGLSSTWASRWPLSRFCHAGVVQAPIGCIITRGREASRLPRRCALIT